MSDTNDDVHIRKIEDRIKASRDPNPCDDFDPVSKHIPLCSFCGHDEDSHDGHEEKVTTTKTYVPTVGDIEREYKTIIGDRKRPKVEKIALINLLKEKTRKVELAAAADFSFPLSEVQKLKELLQRMAEWMKGKGAEF